MIHRPIKLTLDLLSRVEWLKLMLYKHKLYRFLSHKKGQIKEKDQTQLILYQCIIVHPTSKVGLFLYKKILFKTPVFMFCNIQVIILK